MVYTKTYRQASNTFFSLLLASYAIWTLIFLCLICQNPVYRATASVKLKNIFIVTIILNNFFLLLNSHVILGTSSIISLEP